LGWLLEDELPALPVDPPEGACLAAGLLAPPCPAPLPWLAGGFCWLLPLPGPVVGDGL
jgi:hypothetical protein